MKADIVDKTDYLEVLRDSNNIRFIDKSGLSVRGESASLVLFNNEETIRIPYSDFDKDTYPTFSELVETVRGYLDGFQKVGVGKKDQHINFFEQLATYEETTLIDLKPNYGINSLRDDISSTGTGSVTHTGSEYKLETTSGGTGTASLVSKDRGVYISGTILRAGPGIRIPAEPTTDKVLEWGYYNGSDGFYFGVDNTGKFIKLKRGGSNVFKKYQWEWNVDSLDGTGGSGIDLDLSDGNIFNIEFAYYGYGPMEWIIYAKDSDNIQKRIVVHRENQTGTISVENPNLNLSVDITDNSSDEPIEVFVGGRQVSLQGRYSPMNRITGEVRVDQTVGSTNYIPLVSFRRKSAFKGVTIKMEGFEVISDIGLLLTVFVDTTLTGDSFGNPTNYTSQNTGLQSDTSATAISNYGDPIYTGLVRGGDKKTEVGISGRYSMNYNIPEEEIITLAAKSLGADATVTSMLRMVEEW